MEMMICILTHIYNTVKSSIPYQRSGGKYEPTDNTPLLKRGGVYYCVSSGLMDIIKIRIVCRDGKDIDMQLSDTK